MDVPIKMENAMKTVMTLCTALFVGFLFLCPLSVTAADYQNGVTVKILKKSSVTGNGQKIVYPVTDSAEVTAMLVDLPPGAETGWHSHPTPVYAYVLAGTLDVEMEGGPIVTYRSGDAILEVVNTLHNGRNRNTETVRLVVFYTGIVGMPATVKPVAAVAVNERPAVKSHYSRGHRN